MTKRYSYATHLECSASGERYDISVPQNLSKAGKPLLACSLIERPPSGD